MALLRQHEDDLQCGQVAMLWASPQALSQPRVPQRGRPGNFSGCIKGAKYRFALQDGTWDFSLDAVVGKGLI